VEHWNTQLQSTKLNTKRVKKNFGIKKHTSRIKKSPSRTARAFRASPPKEISPFNKEGISIYNI